MRDGVRWERGADERRSTLASLAGKVRPVGVSNGESLPHRRMIGDGSATERPTAVCSNVGCRARCRRGWRARASLFFILWSSTAWLLTAGDVPIRTATLPASPWLFFRARAARREYPTTPRAFVTVNCDRLP